MKNYLGDEQKNTKSFLDKINRVWDFTNNGKRRSILALSILIIGSLIVSMIPFFIGKFVDTSNPIGKTEVLIDTGRLVPVAIYIIVALFAWFILNNIGHRMYVKNMSMNKIRVALLTKIDNLHINKVDGRSAGEYVGYMSNELPAVANLIYVDILGAVESLALILIILLMMLLTNVPLALIYIVVLLLTYFIIRNIGRKMRSDCESNQNYLMDMNSHFDDLFNNHSLMKLYDLEDGVKGEFNNINDKLSHAYTNLIRGIGRVAPIGRVLEVAGFVVFAFAGGFFLQNGQMSVGMFLTFTSYVSLIGSPLLKFSSSINNIQNEMVSFKRVLNVLDSEEIDRSGRSADAISGDITFDEVSFSYGERKILDNVSFTISSGEKVSLDGRAGSGRSTIVDLLIGMRSSESGSVLVDGVDINEYDKNSLRCSIMLIPSAPWIFNGTLMDNIRYASESASDEDVIRASELLGFDKIMRMHDLDYDSLIGSDNTVLMPSDKQILALVRMYLRDPKVVIFDSSFSNIDPYTVSSMIPALNDFLESRTVIMISDNGHNYLSTQRSILLSDGHVMTI